MSSGILDSQALAQLECPLFFDLRHTQSNANHFHRQAVKIPERPRSIVYEVKSFGIVVRNSEQDQCLRSAVAEPCFNFCP